MKKITGKDLESLGFIKRDLFYYKSTGRDEDGSYNNIESKELEKVYSVLIKSHMGGNYGRGKEFVYIKEKNNSQGHIIGRLWYYGDSSATKDVLFNGKIGNKSELIQVLDMIGVSNE